MQGLISSTGDYTRGGLERLDEAVGTGGAAVSSDDGLLLLQFDGERISPEAAATIRTMLLTAPRVPVAMVFNLRGWMETADLNPAGALARLETITAARPRWSDRFVRRGLAGADLADNDPLAAVVDVWRQTGGDRARLIDVMRDLGIVHRSLITAGAALEIEWDGGGYSGYSQAFRFDRGRRIEDQPDGEYGAWCGASYRAVMGSGMPAVEDVDAIIASAGYANRRRYRRVIVPCSSGEVLSVSTLRSDLTLPL